MKSSTELGAICLAAGLTRRPGGAQLLKILLFAKADEVASAVARVGATMDAALSADSTADLDRALRYLADLPEPHEGRLGGLVAKAITWHRTLERQSLAEALEKAHLWSVAARLSAPTRRPPFPLPDVSGIRFLKTVEEVALEGQRMEHCVASRARAALAGECYLFHVDRLGQRATIELSSDGTISEAAGPYNAKNDAVTWGREAIQDWWNEAPATTGSTKRRAPGPAAGDSGQKPGDTWERTIQRLRNPLGDDPPWLAQVDRFHARVTADELAAVRAKSPDRAVQLRDSLMERNAGEANERTAVCSTRRTGPGWRGSEITPAGVERGLRAMAPALKTAAVEAATARRVIDRLAGWHATSVVFEKLRQHKGVSAGRLQSAALRLVVDRFREHRDFRPASTFGVRLVLATAGRERFYARLVDADGARTSPGAPSPWGSTATPGPRSPRPRDRGR